MPPPALDQLAAEWAASLEACARVAGVQADVHPFVEDVLERVRHEARSSNPDFRDAGRKVGGGLADLFHGDPDSLEETQQVLLDYLPGTSTIQVPDVSRRDWMKFTSALARGFASVAWYQGVEAPRRPEQKAQRALFEGEAKFRAVFDISVVGICICNLRHRILNANAALLDIVDREPRDIVGAFAGSVFVPALGDQAFPWHRFQEVADGHVDRFETEAPFRRHDGTEFWGHVTSSLVRDHHGMPAYLISLVQDITGRKTSEARLRRSEQRVRALFQNSSDIVCVLSAAGAMDFISPSLSRVLGFDQEDLLGKPFADLVTEASRMSFELLLEDLRDRPSQTARAELRGHHRDGTWRWLEVVCTNLINVEDVGGFVVNARDVTDRKAFEQQLEWQASHDPLTTLPNRIRFRERLDQQLARAIRDRHAVGVLLIDLDRFKSINDSLGHNNGDQTLISVGQRIRGALEPGESVSRLGGDEFAVLLDDTSLAAATATASRILRALGRPGLVLHRLLSIEASIGIAISNLDSLSEADALLRAADIAAYQAKDRGGATIVSFEPHMRAEAQVRIDLETDLLMALDRNQIEPWFQPVFNLATGAIQGLEVLMRWHRAPHGLTLPDDFLAFAEASGVIGTLGEFTFRTACVKFRSWIDAGLVPDPIYLSLNLSHRETRLPDLVEIVSRIFDETGVDPARVWFEIPERVLMSRDATQGNIAVRLAALGASIAVDKFGSEPSSLALFKDLPIAGMKVARTLHAKVLKTDPEGMIARSIMAIAGRANVQATIVGLETRQHLDDARTLGFQCGQGFHLSPPLNADGIVALLSSPR